MDKSKRLCLDCNCMTTWKRKGKEPHSSCSVCGGFRCARGDIGKKKPKRRHKFPKHKRERLQDDF